MLTFPVIYFDIIDVFEAVDVNKTSTSRECDIHHFNFTCL